MLRTTSARWLPLHCMVLALIGLLGLSGCLSSPASTLEPQHGEWPTYGGSYANTRYASADQITRDNVRQLRVAWRWRSPDHELMARAPHLETFANEATP